jgi:uncharacterized damage-inducible protein DinB
MENVMSPRFTRRPEPTEYAEYYSRYLRHLPDGDVLDALRTGVVEFAGLLSPLDDSQALHRYAPGKWSIKEVLGHMLDVERVFAYRALRIGRGDETPLPGFEQDDYVKIANYDRRALAGLLDEYRHLRAANLELFASFDAADLERAGTASGYRVTARAAIWIIAGHERHHLAGLRRDYL